jgi:ribonucleoside-diphosphate reductase alpha chain
MRIVKRNGSLENVSFDKVIYRLKKLSQDPMLEPLNAIDTDLIAKEVINHIYDGVSTKELDEVAANISISKSTTHPEYSKLASRIVISNMHKNTSGCFSDAMNKLYLHEGAPLVSKKIIDVIDENKDNLNFCIDYSRDYLFDYFGFKTLERSYLLRTNSGKIIERPQHMWLRVSLGIHGRDIKSVIETYDLMSLMYFTHASPTLFNSGTPYSQLSSCFLQGIDDSMEGIYKCISDCAMISKHAGGIGVHVSTVRSKGSYIKGTNGHSDGICRMLKVFNETARFANQGSRRNGSFAIYLEPWHGDIEDFLDLGKKSGNESSRARDLFFALWVCDAFMVAVEEDKDWWLMSSDVSPGLTDVYGKDFDDLYYRYVSEGKFVKVIKARDLWNKILMTQIETGMPYMLYKDSVNEKSNQKNIGVIKSSNLCCEITLVSDTKETAVCNIATLSLGKYVEDDVYGGKVFNYNKLADVTKILVRNLNKVIDENFYPTPETKRSNLRHRPIAIGVQGYANVLYDMKIPFEDSDDLNKRIFETIQYAGWEASMGLSKDSGITYESFEGSPISKGIFQHNMWGISNDELSLPWDSLAESIKKYGVMNSMITSLPPTASTSNILGNVESFEVITNNIYMRSVLSGDFPMVNTYLISDLIHLGLWSTTMKDKILRDNGSIQGIPEIPDHVKKLYKNTWETSQKILIDLSVSRAPFIDQSQSLNIFMGDPDIPKLTSCHFYSWKAGLKTGQYYLRTKPAHSAEKFTVAEDPKEPVIEVCSIDNRSCQSCSG